MIAPLPLDTPGPEYITAAAILMDGVVISAPPPARHHDLILGTATVDDRRETIARPRLIRGLQGFLTDRGRFIERNEARQIAVASGQCANPRHPELLFSEDLW